MVISQLFGATGNQLFEYAVARHVAIINNAELKLDKNLFELKFENQRWYGLGVFNIVEKFATSEEIAALKDRKPNAIDLIKSKLTGKLPIFDMKEVSGYAFDPDVLKLGGNVYLEGYWQSYKYFEAISGILRLELQVKVPPASADQRLLDIAKQTNSVSLHVRRGDYVSDAKANSYLGALGIDYYENAIELIKQKVKDPHFFIFSDDPDWAKANIKTDAPTEYSYNPIELGYQDLRIMYSCNYNIIANSSFSWWGAWLNPHPDKIVIAPKRWHKQEGISTDDLIPENWLRL